ncbi:MAG: S41 family peptidase [Planctomycetota bacterium]
MMRRVFGGLLAAALMAGPTAGAVSAGAAGSVGGDGYPAREISGRDALSDIKLLERVLTTVHAGWGRYTSEDEMDAAFGRLRRAVRGGTTDADMYLEVSRLLELIRCDHTKAEYPDALRSWRESNRSFMPVRTHVFGGRLYAGTNRIDGMGEGDEILSINGVVTKRALGAVRGLISIDGNTEHARDAELTLSSEYMGSGLDTFMPLVFGWAETFEFVVRDSNGEERQASGRALTFDGFESMVRSGEPFVRDFKDAVSVERPGDGTALLRVDTFVNYRDPVDPDEVYGSIMSALNREGVEHLIVDLRRNGGGSNDAAESLFRHLIAEPVETEQFALVRTVPVPQDVKDAVNTWDRSALEAERDMFERAGNGMWRMRGGGAATMMPAPDHFRGRVTVLSSIANSSGSTMTIAGLQRAGIRVVGEPTGGSVEGPTAGILVFLKLPNSDINVRVPLIRSVTGLSPAEPGMGVVPDVPVDITAAGFFAGRDEVLEAARSEW